MDELAIRESQDRSRINLSDDHGVRHWTKHLGVSRNELEKAIANGNTAAAVRKEPGLLSAAH